MTIPSGMTIDGVPVPLDVESDGPEAIEAFITGTPSPLPLVADVAPNPPSFAEGGES